MKIGIKQISQLSGFSPATVSNVLNHKKGVNPQTAEQILKIAHETGYLKETRIRAIRLVLYKKHGKVVTDTPFFSSLIEGVERECRASGFSLEVVGLDRNEKDFEAVLRNLLRDYTAALLVLGTELTEKDMAPFEAAASPVVVVDSWIPSMKFDAVLINNSDAVCDAVTRLATLGHVEIGYLKSAVSIRNFEYRADGYRRALAEAGLKEIPAYTIPLTPTMEGAYQDMAAYLSASPKLATAYFADNDIIALGAARALKEHGIQIPGDVSLIGFDDMPFCEISSPPLTTIRVFKEEMGAMAVRQMADRIHGSGSARVKIELCTEFVERGSVRDLRQG